MCGILGWLCHPDPARIPAFNTALDLLAHRGPDDRGIWESSEILLGHRRLSILDLSSAGHQPMVEPQSGAVMVFNGEIYNHVELRDKLERHGHTFTSRSDTEVLLHALLQWGDSALDRLNGMWAFALWRPSIRTLLLARDRFGVKPLYYCNGPKGFAFASEPKALLGLFPALRKPNHQALADFLVNNSLYGSGQSFYDGIQVLPPAHFATIGPSDSALQIRRYWDYPGEGEVMAQESPQESVAQFAALFADAVRLRMRSDVSVGVTLSGGLDSTAVLAASRDHSALVPTCFTSVYDAGHQGELSWATLASESVGTKLIPVSASRDGWLSVLRQVAWHMDGPGYSPAVYPLWCLMKRAREEGIPVLLEGQGADEALAGYPQYAVLELLAYMGGRYSGSRNIAGVANRMSSLGKTFTLRWSLAWLAREMWPQLRERRSRRTGFLSLLRDGVEFPQVVAEPETPQADPVRSRLLHEHSKTILPGLLHYGDAVSMAHSIEARNPFLDYRLVEWLFRRPTGIKLHEGETKWVLREYLRNHGQTAIGNRRDKQGYPTPARDWLAADRGREVENMLLNCSGPLREWLDPEKIRRLIESNRRGTLGADHHLYKLLSTQVWLSECIDSKI